MKRMRIRSFSLPHLPMPEEALDPSDVTGLPLGKDDLVPSGEPQGRKNIAKSLGLPENALEDDDTDDDDLDDEDADDDDEETPSQRSKKEEKPSKKRSKGKQSEEDE